MDRKGTSGRGASPEEKLQRVAKAADEANDCHTPVPQREKAGGDRGRRAGVKQRGPGPAKRRGPRGRKPGTWNCGKVSGRECPLLAASVPSVSPGEGGRGG